MCRSKFEMHFWLPLLAFLLSLSCFVHWMQQLFLHAKLVNLPTVLYGIVILFYLGFLILSKNPYVTRPHKINRHCGGWMLCPPVSSCGTVPGTCHDPFFWRQEIMVQAGRQVTQNNDTHHPVLVQEQGHELLRGLTIGGLISIWWTHSAMAGCVLLGWFFFSLNDLLQAPVVLLVK
jgi:hypothetical protein